MSIKEIQKKIVDNINTNRISTTEVADCLNKSGNIDNVLPLNDGHFKVGDVFWVYAYGGTNWDVHYQIINAPKDSVVLIECFECDNKAIFGELVAKYLILYRQVKAIVVCGLLRDIPHLLKENWPIWCMGRSPIGCSNKDISNEKSLDIKIIEERKKYYKNSVAICDDSGVVIIREKNISEEFQLKLTDIELQEDIWFDCIDRLKWNTYDTVCLKKYKDENRKS